MPIRLFHASTKKYLPGTKVRNDATARRETVTNLPEPPNRTPEWLAKTRRDRVERALEALRPPDLKHSRLGASFAFARPVYARAYLESENRSAGSASIHIYEVTMDAPTEAAMPLVDHATKAQDEDTKLMEMIIKAYWASADHWNFVEYFAPEMTIVRELPLDDTLEHNIEASKAIMKLDEDKDRAKELFPIPKRASHT